jgi:hypothetical protein
MRCCGWIVVSRNEMLWEWLIGSTALSQTPQGYGWNVVATVVSVPAHNVGNVHTT